MSEEHKAVGPAKFALVKAEYLCGCGKPQMCLTSAAILPDGRIGPPQHSYERVQCDECRKAERQKANDEFRLAKERRNWAAGKVAK